MEDVGIIFHFKNGIQDCGCLNAAGDLTIPINDANHKAAMLLYRLISKKYLFRLTHMNFIGI